MNDLTKIPVDIEEQRNWLIDHRQSQGLSWAELAKRTGIKQGTVSQFASDKGYGGDEAKCAEQVMRYRQWLASQAILEIDVPVSPDFFQTETSLQLEQMLAYAHRGKMVAAALEAGLGKTSSAAHYAESYPNVVNVELRKSAHSVNNMQTMVLKALGEKNPPTGTLQKSERICEMLSKLGRPLLILDEAQHLGEDSLEEIRGWHDDIDLGVGFFGNVGILQRLQRYAQLYSRISMKVQRRLPLHGDIAALADAWHIFDEKVRAKLQQICLTAGGLRNGSHTLELASMLASADKAPLNIEHLSDAWAQLSSRVAA